MSDPGDTLPDMATRASRRARLKLGRRDRDEEAAADAQAAADGTAAATEPGGAHAGRTEDGPRPRHDPGARRSTPTRASRTSS
jgi:hypothetical protein